MNERIKQLCEQSKKYANESTKNFTGAEPVCWMDYYTEMLAELIVRECANAIQEEKDTGLYNAQRMAGMTISKIVIKDHFGIEE